MTHDDIIALAREAGLFVPPAGIPENGALTRFAALVAERDKALLRQALEAMEKASGFMRDSDYVKLNQTIDVLRERLGEKT